MMVTMAVSGVTTAARSESARLPLVLTGRCVILTPSVASCWHKARMLACSTWVVTMWRFPVVAKALRMAVLLLSVPPLVRQLR